MTLLARPPPRCMTTYSLSWWILLLHTSYSRNKSVRSAAKYYAVVTVVCVFLKRSISIYMFWQLKGEFNAVSRQPVVVVVVVVVVVSTVVAECDPEPQQKHDTTEWLGK